MATYTAEIVVRVTVDEDMKCATAADVIGTPSESQISILDENGLRLTAAEVELADTVWNIAGDALVGAFESAWPTRHEGSGSMSKHTPARWYCARTAGGALIVRPTDSRRGIVASLTDENALVRSEWTRQDYKNAEANGHLIAAAPALYDALRALVAEYAPNIKTFASNAPRKEKWETALELLARIDAGPINLEDFK